MQPLNMRSAQPFPMNFGQKSPYIPYIVPPQIDDLVAKGKKGIDRLSPEELQELNRYIGYNSKYPGSKSVEMELTGRRKLTTDALKLLQKENFIAENNHVVTTGRSASLLTKDTTRYLH